MGRIEKAFIEEEMERSYINYAMSVIRGRAIPDVRDGLKPVQRRILYGMHELGLTPGKPHKKSARIVGETMGKYHPHGDVAIYDTMVNMAQLFSYRYPLIDGQGNFGCFTGETKIKLLDGTEKSFAELAKLPPDEVFYVYSVDRSGRIVVGEGRDARITRRNASLMELTLDNGETVRCTPDHRFLLRVGTYKQARDLTADDSLMPGYFDTAPIKEGLMVKEAQTYNHRVVAKRMLAEQADVYDITVDVHHNFLLAGGVFVHNSIDGDPAAAMRYTEARLAPIATEFLEELGEETVEWMPNFDDSLKEPVVLPAKVPNLLMNGAWGISVGMTTQIPPHNLGELIDGTIYLLDHPDASVRDLMQFIPGPDFPTGGIIMGREGIEEMYRTGSGKFTVRGKATIEDDRIIISEIPYQVRKSALVEAIAAKVHSGEIDGISDLRDESDREGLRIVVDFKQSANPNVILNRLYKFTPLERTYAAIFLVIIDGNPRTLSLKEILNSFIDFRREVVRRRTEHRLKVARARAHILAGFRTALTNIERVIEILHAARDSSTAAAHLKEELALSDAQTDAILKMRLSQLTGLEREKIDTEYVGKQEEIKGYEQVLGSDELLDETIKQELRAVADKHGDERRTLITDESGEVDFTSLIPDYDLMVSVTRRGYASAPRAHEFRSQGRGGKGVIGQRTKEDDYISCCALANARDEILLFTDKRRVYRTQGYRLPSSKRGATGKNLRTLIAMDQDEVVRAILPVPDFSDVEDRFCLMATENGIVNRNRLRDYANVYTNGIIALNADEDDHLVDVAATTGDGEVILATHQGKTIRFHESEVRLTRRPSRGVIGIRLDPGDRVIGMAPIEREITMDKKLLMVTARGYGKRVSLVDFPLQGRGGKGVLGIKIDRESGPLVSIGIVSDQDEIIITTEQKVIRILTGEINTYGRYARGVRLIQLEEDDHIVSVVRT